MCYQLESIGQIYHVYKNYFNFYGSKSCIYKQLTCKLNTLYKLDSDTEHYERLNKQATEISEISLFISKVEKIRTKLIYSRLRSRITATHRARAGS